MATILLAEDDRLLRAFVCDCLKSAGHEVLEVEDGAMALSVLAGHRVDLLVTDILMPERDGLEVIREARRQMPVLPILAISGGGREKWNDALRVARNFGATDAIEKPFVARELLACVERLLANR